MSVLPFATFLFLLLLTIPNPITCKNQIHLHVQAARNGVMRAAELARAWMELKEYAGRSSSSLCYCIGLYEDAEARLSRVVSSEGYGRDDVLTWLSAALASHRSCMEENEGALGGEEAHNLTLLLTEALGFHNGHESTLKSRSEGVRKKPNFNQNGGLLMSWNAATSKADLVVAQDGSGGYKTINEVVAALAGMGHNRPERVVIYVKKGMYNERVEIRRGLKNVMFVGDGMDNTMVTGDRNVQDGGSTLSSVTFGVSADGFWARDMTFENTAGPQKHQAVALKVASDHSIFYRCNFKGYQNTLLVHSLRQFYSQCHVYGTVDFIFGDASAIFQDCDIFVRRPTDHQSNMITAQGRDNPNENTGISIVSSRVRSAQDLDAIKGHFRTYLGRPWKKYSRTVFAKTDLDGLIDRKGWTEWRGDFALSTLYYGEFMNSGGGASTANRVKWPGFHVLNAQEASLFSVRNFIQGESWIPEAGVPFRP